jgi:hypothetical protein
MCCILQYFFSKIDHRSYVLMVMISASQVGSQKVPSSILGGTILLHLKPVIMIRSIDLLVDGGEGFEI